MAIDKGLGEGLAKARAVRSAKKAPAPVEKTKAPTKTKALVPAVKKKHLLLL